MRRLLLLITLTVGWGMLYAYSVDGNFDSDNNTDYVVDCDSAVSFEADSIYVSGPFSESTTFIDETKSLPGCTEFRYTRSFALNDSACNADFQIYVAVPPNMPQYMMDFFDLDIRQKLRSDFFTFGDDGEEEYPIIPDFKSQSLSLEPMAEFFYKQYCDLYIMECSALEDSIGLVYGQSYSFQFCAIPVWQNSDKTLTTWKFYEYIYANGPHCSEKEFYITFDNKKGKMLGAEDLFTPVGFKYAIKRLTQQLAIEKGLEAWQDPKITADLDDCANSDSRVFIEVVQGKKYPRPALIEEGVVFSYQPYQKTGGADDELHLIQPYSKEIRHRRIKY